MANYTVERAKSAAAGVAIEDVITLNADYERVRIVNRDGVDVLWLRVDNTAVTVAGDDAIPVMPGTTLVINTPKYGATTIVRVISAAACDYSIVGEL